MSAKITWRGVPQMSANCLTYADRVRAAVRAVADYFAPVMERYAKQNAPWTDRTSNARQSLYTMVEELSQDAVVLYLSHGVNYGVFLEVRWNGRYATIWPTIQAHLDAITKMLKGIFS